KSTPRAVSNHLLTIAGRRLRSPQDAQSTLHRCHPSLTGDCHAKRPVAAYSDPRVAGSGSIFADYWKCPHSTQPYIREVNVIIRNITKELRSQGLFDLRDPRWTYVLALLAQIGQIKRKPPVCRQFS